MSEEIPIDQQQQQPYQFNTPPSTTEVSGGEAFQQPVSSSTGVVVPPLNTNTGAPDSSEQARLEEMEKEAVKLRELHSSMQMDEGSDSSSIQQSEEEKREKDSRSIYVGNVDYSVTPQELATLFSASGVVNKVTILTNKFTGQPKGFAYLEFADVDAVNKAVATQDGASLRERELKVSAKRTNIPGLSTTNRGGRGGRGGRGAFRGGRGGFFRGGRGGGFRGGRGAFRGGSRFAPY